MKCDTLGNHLDLLSLDSDCQSPGLRSQIAFLRDSRVTPPWTALQYRRQLRRSPRTTATEKAPGEAAWGQAGAEGRRGREAAAARRREGSGLRRAAAPAPARIPRRGQTPSRLARPGRRRRIAGRLVTRSGVPPGGARGGAASPALERGDRRGAGRRTARGTRGRTLHAMGERAAHGCCLGWDFSTQQVAAPGGRRRARGPGPGRAAGFRASRPPGVWPASCAPEPGRAGRGAARPAGGSQGRAAVRERQAAPGPGSPPETCFYSEMGTVCRGLCPSLAGTGTPGSAELGLLAVEGLRGPHTGGQSGNLPSNLGAGAPGALCSWGINTVESNPSPQMVRGGRSPSI